MGIDAIKTGNITNMPQFKAAKDAGNATKPETKENGNALLYGSIAALAVVGLGIAYKAYKGKAKDFDKLKELGYKFENKLLTPDLTTKFDTLKIIKSNELRTITKNNIVYFYYPENLDFNNNEIQKALKEAHFKAIKIEAKNYLPQRLEFLAKKYGM